jgi:hypothetical protein
MVSVLIIFVHLDFFDILHSARGYKPTIFSVSLSHCKRVVK